MKQQWSRILLGVVLILAGLGYAGDVMDFWHLIYFSTVGELIYHRPLSFFLCGKRL